MKGKKLFCFEMTDTFGGELNYCWLHRFIVSANTERGAISKLSREVGYNFKYDGMVYRAKSACVASYIIDCEVDSAWEEQAVKI